MPGWGRLPGAERRSPLRLQRFVVDASPDQTQFAASAAVNASPSRASPFARAVPPAGAGEGAAEVGHEAEFRREQLKKRSGTGRHDDVADERKAHSRAGRDSVDRDHDGYAQSIPVSHHRIEVILETRANIFSAAALWIRDEIIAHEIRARTEGAPRAGQHHRANGGIGIDRGGGGFEGRRSNARLRAFNRSGRLSATYAMPLAALESQRVKWHDDSGGVGTE